jgi:hypothetical protein
MNILEATLTWIDIQKQIADSHPVTATEVKDRAWLDKCVVLADHIKELQARVAMSCEVHGHSNIVLDHDGTDFLRCEVCGVNAVDQLEPDHT